MAAQLYSETTVGCSVCFAGLHHYVEVDGVIFCEQDAPTDETGETWLKFDSDDDEDASHEATVDRHVDGERYVVGWCHADVGQVTERTFDTLEAAHAFLEGAGYADFTA